MTKSPSPIKLTPFHIRTKYLKKDTATLFIRIHTRKVDVLVSTMLQVEFADWQKATASPRAWLAHQKKNYQLHAKLTQIDRAFVSRYINYLQKHGYMAKVVNKHLTNLKALQRRLH